MVEKIFGSVNNLLFCLSFVSFGFSILSYFFGEKIDTQGGKVNKFKIWPYLVSLSVSIFVGGLLSGFMLISTNIDSFSFGDKTVSFSVFTAFVATGSLCVAIGTLFKNSKFNKETHDIQFVMKLIENNYTMFKEERKNLSIILDKLDKYFNNNGQLLEKNIATLTEYWRNNEVTILAAIEQSEASITKGSGTSGKKAGILKDLKELKILNYNVVERIVITQMSDQSPSIFSNLLTSEQNKVFKYLNKTNHQKEIRQIFSLFEKQFDLKEEKLCYDDIFKKCNEIFNEHYDETGTFLRHTYRIVKFINLKIEDKNMQKELRGLLRAQFSEKVMLGIFYNSTFTEKGLGFGIQLLNSDFFGDTNDLNTDDSVHFNKNSFVTKDGIEKFLMKEFFISTNNISFDNEQKFKEEMNSKTKSR